MSLADIKIKIGGDAKKEAEKIFENARLKQIKFKKTLMLKSRKSMILY